MKNPFKLLYNWILKQFRKRQFNKRQSVYQEVTDILTPLIEAKKKAQTDLMDEIKENSLKVAGVHYGSKFIPNTATKTIDFYNKVNAEYGERMEELGIKLTLDLQLVCIH